MMKIRVNINLDCVDEVVSKDDEYDQDFFFFFWLMYHVLLLLSLAN